MLHPSPDVDSGSFWALVPASRTNAQMLSRVRGVGGILKFAEFHHKVEDMRVGSEEAGSPGGWREQQCLRLSPQSD